MLTKILLFSCIIGLLLVTGFALAQENSSTRTKDATYFMERIAAIQNASPTEAQPLVDALWDELNAYQQVPLIDGDQVTFLYRGDVRSVDWRGDFTGWRYNRSTQGQRVNETDLWMMSMQLPIDARVEYKIVVNNDQWILDPANPNTQRGGFGANNVVIMPQFESTAFTERRDGIPRGNVSLPRTIESEALDYTLSIWIYTPANYHELDNLPVFYVTDGNDFIHEEMGAMPIILDNLIADGVIPPVMAVFIDARDPLTTANRRMSEYVTNPKYADFIATELVPYIDERFKTNPSPDARYIQGTSLGGVASLYIASEHPDVFHNIVAFSPALWTRPSLPNNFRLVRDVPYRTFLSTGIAQWDVGNLQSVASLLGRFGHEVELAQVQEGHTWGQWSELTDEMLRFFLAES